jgi:hypothetical protein
LTSRERVLRALSHQEPGQVPVDFGSTSVTGIHVSCVAALREHFGLESRLVKVWDPGQMLGVLDEDLKAALRIDVEGLPRRKNRYGYENANWKPWRMPDGLVVLVPGEFHTTVAPNGDILMYPQGDTAVPPSARMPADGYFFDDIVRQPPIDDEHLDPAANTEEFGLLPQEDIDWFRATAAAAHATGRAVLAMAPGAGLGDIGLISGPSLKDPRGIRSPEDWYISIRSRPGYVQAVFQRQTDIALQNLKRIHAAAGHLIDVIYICGTDFGTQNSAFCSTAAFGEIWLPFYQRINDWIHANTTWKCFKHSCGSVYRFLPQFIEAGFDILNPVQCSARDMQPARLKREVGSQITFWGGAIDTQHVLPFGSPGEVRAQVLERCRTFAPGGGFVFNAIHNIQARTPVANLVALFAAVREFNSAGLG